MATTTEFKFDESAFNAALDKQEAYLKPFAGKKHHNPFFAMKEVLDCRAAFKKGDRSKELFDKALGLKQVAPVTDAAALKAEAEAAATKK